MKRREFVLAATAGVLGAPAFAARMESGVSAAEIVLGQTAVVGGVL
jgi:hypothetical protein